MKTKFAAIADLTVGYAFASASFSHDPKHVRLLRGTNVGVGRPDWTDVKYWDVISNPVDDELSLVEGDIVIAMDASFTSSGVLRASRVIEPDLPALLVQRVARVRPKMGYDKRFLWYLVQSKEFARQIGAQQTGSVISHVSGSQIGAVEVEVPRVEIQQAIAGVLGALDDKIESNRRQMSTLGSMVQLVFLSQASEANREALLSIATVQKGVSYRSIDLQESKTAMMTLKSIDRNGGYKADGLKPYVGAYKATQVIRPGEFVVAQTDLTQGAEVVGRVVLVPRQSKFETLIASLDLAIVRPIDPADHWYLYAALVQEDFREHCRSRTSGTTVLHLGADALPSYRVPWSDSRARMRVASEVESLVRLAESRGQEIDHLMALRDTLLPELLSGRVQVRDAEKFVEGAV